ncbi:hypothetical protein [Actinokineospora cianjurensis]|uniref:Uncharacterized protein n=1 Tax=Actinokineospora cianjurensis TaxID=585224 RepID=A0A421B299_9PSEU|nr:hypothetical protein [Actinokineospora cianjurensis]RLK58468.1 hypothetical protein CLV68_4574 [Actinokineospora cianjurensis]
MADFRISYDAADGTALSSPISGEDYIEVLLARQAAYQGAHPYRFPPLLEWFVRDEDVDYVELPKPAPKRTTTPRVYRGAASIRGELKRVDAQLAAIGASGPTDRAAANLSPFARSKTAARAGRARFARMDRDLERYTALTRRRDQLAGRLAVAAAREKQSAANIARRKLVEKFPESRSAEEVSEMSDAEAFNAALLCGLLEG